MRQSHAVFIALAILIMIQITGLETYTFYKDPYIWSLLMFLILLPKNAYTEYGLGVVAVSFILLPLFLTYGKDTKEQYTVQGLSVGQQALRDVDSGKVKASKGSIHKVTLTQVTIQPKQKSLGETLSNVLNPIETVVFRGRPKYVLKNAIIVGSWIKFEATGRTIADATSNANKRASTDLASIKKSLEAAGLLQSS